MTAAVQSLKVPCGRSTSTVPPANDVAAQQQAVVYTRSGSKKGAKSWYAGASNVSLDSVEDSLSPETSRELQHIVEVRRTSNRADKESDSLSPETSRDLQYMAEVRKASKRTEVRTTNNEAEVRQTTKEAEARKTSKETEGRRTSNEAELRKASKESKLGLRRDLVYGRGFDFQPSSSTPRTYRPRISSQRSTGNVNTPRAYRPRVSSQPSPGNTGTPHRYRPRESSQRSTNTPRRARDIPRRASTRSTTPCARTEDSFSTCSTVPDDGDVPTFLHLGCQWPPCQKEANFAFGDTLQAPLLSDGHCSSCDLERQSFADAYSVGASTGKMAAQREWSFSIASDTILMRCGLILGCFLILSSVVCLLCAESEHESSSDVASVMLCVAAVLLLLLSMVVFFRLGTPEMLHISYVDNEWVISLHRRGLTPERRPLRDLEAFVESFSYCSILQVELWLNGIGHTTSGCGTIHLVFAKSVAGHAVCMNASLRDPLAFFSKLRDVMYVTQHELTDNVAEYVEAWVPGDP